VHDKDIVHGNLTAVGFIRYTLCRNDGSTI
jgi:hypothetical protein